MWKSRTSWAAAFVLFLCGTALGQGRPSHPGQPVDAAAVQTVVDSNGKLVGEVILPSNHSGAVVRYALPDGSNTVLVANANRLAPVNAGSIDRADEPDRAMVFFTTGDCSGAAYVFADFGPVPEQMTKRQVILLEGLRVDPNPPPASGTCAVPFPGEDWLFASEPLACWQGMHDGHTLTFNSYYGDNWSDGSACAASPGYTIPNSSRGPGVYKIYQPIEDLRATFKAPFYIP